MEIIMKKNKFNLIPVILVLALCCFSFAMAQTQTTVNISKSSISAKANMESSFMLHGCRRPEHGCVL